MDQIRDLLEKRLKIAQEMVEQADKVYPNEVMRCRAKLEVIDTQIALLRHDAEAVLRSGVAASTEKAKVK